MKVAIVDDEQELTDELVVLFRREGFEAVGYYDLWDAEVAILSDPQPVAIILDHNFAGTSRVGYDLCHAVRMRHPYGLILPIIYRSAVEQAEAYLAHERFNLANAPSAFLDKLGSEDQLVSVVRNSVERFELLVTTLLRQATDQSLHELERKPPKQDDLREGAEAGDDDLHS